MCFWLLHMSVILALTPDLHVHVCCGCVAQLQKLQADMESLREQRENTISNTREELYNAQEEVLMLRRAMDEATRERECEISALQDDLRGVTAELDKWKQAATKYELEISTLQASFQQQSQHQAKAAQLQGTHRGAAFWSTLAQSQCLL